MFVDDYVVVIWLIAPRGVFVLYGRRLTSLRRINAVVKLSSPRAHLAYLMA